MTIRFEVTFGVAPGYGANENPAWARASPIARVAQLWNFHMEQRVREGGPLVSAVLTESLAVYPGCPAGGEHTVTVCGAMHPHALRVCDVETWKGTVRTIVYMVREELRQRTAMIVFSAAEVKYLVGEEDPS